MADDHITGSDHKDMQWKVIPDSQQEADHERVVRTNMAATGVKDKEAVEKLWMELAKKRAYLDAECPEDEVQQEVAYCHESKRCILNATAKTIRMCTISKM